MEEDTVRVGLITYRHNCSVIFKLNAFSRKDDIKRAVMDTPYVGGTSIAPAIRKAQTDMFTVSTH
ncbi:hypothetical protein DPMN_130109 [Dreissena polymorpha]|uniref:VWFA domain-containing protein n=1 Tax=Dreissena polymorpha TaxID=45954 RepID=A0A9D4K139_DREPO|nr:hypothetical protein DPMN_130109 [Dreissena polymorpha]